MNPNEKVLKLSAENENLLKNLNKLTKSDYDLRLQLEKSNLKNNVFSNIFINNLFIFFRI